MASWTKEMRMTANSAPDNVAQRQLDCVSTGFSIKTSHLKALFKSKDGCDAIDQALFFHFPLLVSSIFFLLAMRECFYFFDSFHSFERNGCLALSHLVPKQGPKDINTNVNVNTTVGA